MKTSTKYIIGITSALSLIGIGVVVYKKRFGISRLAKKAISVAEQEFEEWNKDGKKIKEGDDLTFDRLKKYWEEGANTFWSKAKMINEAWSAAFISYIMKKSGAGNDFKYSTSHSVYIRDAIKNRKENNKNPFKGFKPEEVSVKNGDIVCYARQIGVGYDTTGSYISHCDIVTDVKNNKAITVGGNVSNSVSKTEVDLDKENKILNDKYFVVIKNNKNGL